MRAVLQLRAKLAAGEHVVGVPPLASSVSVLLEGDADVYRPDGQVLCMLRRDALGPQIPVAYDALHFLRKYTTTNRGKYAGEHRVEKVFADGVKSKNTHTAPVASAIVGYFDRMGGRFPYCRATAFTGDEAERWETLLPMVEAVGHLFEKELPGRFERQMAMAEAAPAEYVIHTRRGLSPFTTLTVNNNVAPSGVHADKGDYKDGIGIISCVRRGDYSGGLLVFSEYGLGVDLRDGDVIFFNSHEWHGVTAMEKRSEDAERITIVYYLREKIVRCKSPAAELQNAKRVRGAL